MNSSEKGKGGIWNAEALAGTGTVYSSGALGSGSITGAHFCGGVSGTPDRK